MWVAKAAQNISFCQVTVQRGHFDLQKIFLAGKAVYEGKFDFRDIEFAGFCQNPSNGFEILPALQKCRQLPHLTPVGARTRQRLVDGRENFDNLFF